LLPFVFDRFRQADSSSTRSQGGLGIGLALVKSLTELHGGSVQAESAGVGQGATFRLRFPSLASPAGVEARQPRRALAAGPVASLAGVRVLVVEDDRDSRELIGGVLARGGAEVHTAENADDALASLGDWRADVIVTDIEMPDDDGYALLRRVRALPEAQGGGVPIVAITAQGGAEDGARLLAAGFQAHVPKPFEPAELVALLAGVTRSPRAA
jgi:CheY-like chemotaxis protein